MFCRLNSIMVPRRFLQQSNPEIVLSTSSSQLLYVKDQTISTSWILAPNSSLGISHQSEEICTCIRFRIISQPNSFLLFFTGGDWLSSWDEHFCLFSTKTTISKSTTFTQGYSRFISQEKQVTDLHWSPQVNGFYTESLLLNDPKDSSFYTLKLYNSIILFVVASITRV